MSGHGTTSLSKRHKALPRVEVAKKLHMILVQKPLRVQKKLILATRLFVGTILSAGMLTRVEARRSLLAES
jgi:hypothetical protein